jgi:hypothetical protein
MADSINLLAVGRRGYRYRRRLVGHDALRTSPDDGGREPRTES